MIQTLSLEIPLSFSSHALQTLIIKPDSLELILLKLLSLTTWN